MLIQNLLFILLYLTALDFLNSLNLHISQVRPQVSVWARNEYMSFTDSVWPTANIRVTRSCWEVQGWSVTSILQKTLLHRRSFIRATLNILLEERIHACRAQVKHWEVLKECVLCVYFASIKKVLKGKLHGFLDLRIHFCSTWSQSMEKKKSIVTSDLDNALLISKKPPSFNYLQIRFCQSHS